jgi:two-component sensor histidine kinase
MALLKAIVAPHEDRQKPQIAITGSDAPLRGNALTSLALLLHELTTNAAKYGALSTAAGHLSVDISMSDGILNLRWVERGSPSSNSVKDREGFGTTLEKAALKGLGATIGRCWTTDGLSLLLEIPVANLVT